MLLKMPTIVSMKFSLLINMKMPTIVENANYCEHVIFSDNKYENANYCWHFHFY